ncbi:heme exporter protein CcmD [uncultured Cocleimonas sp.]|uniref:heme exporter protein CcmD n=1 Tax=uncultured Cocleimonas sp. TaxID=1051587 RepID=UPI002615407E|nr:heme exporter protein CcmD [uncultured Cocleimonas sp.]
MNEFFHMGGFGAYIWSAMGIAALLMVLEPVTLVFRRRSVIAQIKRNKRLEERRLNNEKN